MKKIRVIIAGFLAICLHSKAQIWNAVPLSDNKNGTLTSTVYDWEAIGINPANLGWSNNHNLSFSVLNVGLAGQSRTLNFPALMTALHTSNVFAAANSWQTIMGSPGGLNTTADINWAAVSFRLPKVPGAFAVNLDDKINGNGFLSVNTSIALNSDIRSFNDQTILTILQGTALRYTHYREINVAYGSPLLSLGGKSDNDIPDVAKCFSFSGKTGRSGGGIALYGGVGVKYVMGLSNVNGDVNNGINTTYAMANNYPGTFPGFIKAPGHGFGFDLGLGADWRKWTFGFSITDIGSVRWKHVLTTTGDTNVAAIAHGSDFFNELKTGTVPGSVAAPDVVTDLPTKMRFGATYRLNRKVLLSGDVLIPLNDAIDNISGPYIALGGQENVGRYVSLYNGLAYASGYGLTLPIGATFHATRHVDFYVGTTDIAGYAGRRNNSNVSAGVGLLRYHF